MVWFRLRDRIVTARELRGMDGGRSRADFVIVCALQAPCVREPSRESLCETPLRFSFESSSGVPGDVLVLGVVARDQERLVAVGGRAERDPGVVLTSADAGRTWSVAQQPAPARLYDVAIADRTTCVAVGLASTIVRSTDGGATWSLVHAETDGWRASDDAAWQLTGLDDSAAWCGFAPAAAAIVAVGERGRIGRLVLVATGRN